MVQQIDQLEVFVKMVRALDAGKNIQVKKADKLIRKVMFEEKKRGKCSSSFLLTPEELVFLDSLHQALQ